MAELPKVSIVTDEGEFDRLRATWTGLLQQSLSNSIFLTWEWARAWWQSYGAGKELWILKVESSGHVVGVAPFYRRTVQKFGLFGYRGVYLLGDGSADSDYLDVMSRAGDEELVGRALGRFLLEHRAEWDIFFFHEVPDTSPNLKVLRAFFRDEGCQWEEEPVPCAYVQLPPDWEAYVQSLKPRMRTKIRSIMRRLEDAHTVRIEGSTHPEELETRLTSFFEQHGRRWEMRGEEGVFQRPDKRQFYGEIARRALAQGWLRLYALFVDDTCVAQQFCLEYRSQMLLLQEGFDPRWAAEEVGNALRGYVFRDCIARKVTVYDFLAGVTFHKLSWGAQTKVSLRIQIGAATWRSRIFFAVPRWRRWAKARVERTIPSSVLEWIREMRSR